MPRSDSFGRAFEYICIQSLEAEISKVRPVTIIKNASYYQDKVAWESMDESDQSLMRKGAKAAIPTLMDLEPKIEENSGNILTLKLQADTEGIIGDVRDILIIRDDVEWIIGISVKHNNFAVKHSRLSSHLDFGSMWLDMPCSATYWEDVKPIFTPLKESRGRVAWSQFPNKATAVYIPLLKAFMDEIKRDYQIDNSVPAKLVEYLLGKYDFYKLIGIDSEQETRLMAFNLRGTLNKSSQKKKPSRLIPVSLLPTRIVSLEMKPQSTNTAELYMDNGWQFTFRIHNASTMVEPSLKFDVQIVGMPTTIITINCAW